MSVKFVFLFTTLLICKNIILASSNYATVAINQEGKTSVYMKKLHKGELQQTGYIIAEASFANSINATGWSYFQVRTNGTVDDSVQAYWAGFLEGLLTSEIIYQHWFNTIRTYCDGQMKLCKNINKFLHENTVWARSQAEDFSKFDPAWHQVDLFYKQIDGLLAGYNSSRGHRDMIRALDFKDFLWMNVQGDLEDLSQALNVDGKLPSLRVMGTGSCSSLIKLLPNMTDLLAAHDTWTSYSSLIRIAKKYVLPYQTSGKSKMKIPGTTMVFTSYPGSITSGDDFYILSNGLVAMETTIGNSNSSLWKHVAPTGTLLECVRSTIANRFANNGRSWCEYFSVMNSGTYNNQWMLIDYNKFKTGQEPEAGLLWVLEQIPGHIRMEDKTNILLKKGYWASYNVPYFPDIFKLSGNQALVDKYGDWFSYKRTPRALIFKRDQGNVKDLASLLDLMRSNDFQHDPLSKCNCTPPYSAENAIAARNDLNPRNGTYPFGALGHRSHGAIDAKVINSTLFKSMQYIGVSGPTRGSSSCLPAFQWSKTDFPNTPHMGHPDLWNFSPELFEWFF